MTINGFTQLLTMSERKVVVLSFIISETWSRNRTVCQGLWLWGVKICICTHILLFWYCIYLRFHDNKRTCEQGLFKSAAQHKGVCGHLCGPRTARHLWYHGICVGFFTFFYNLLLLVTKILWALWSPDIENKTSFRRCLYTELSVSPEQGNNRWLYFWSLLCAAAGLGFLPELCPGVSLSAEWRSVSTRATTNKVLLLKPCTHNYSSKQSP